MSIFKSYDLGFFISQSSYQKDTKISINQILNFPLLKNLYEIFSSKEMCSKINNLCSDDIPRKLYSFCLTQASRGSGLIQHKDGVVDSLYGASFLNLILFLDGCNPPIDSGGTSIYKSNEKEALLESPKSLKNSFLIYRSTANLYHGFPPMKGNMKRKAILIQYAHAELIKD